uniref:Uncharacterized protein n=1 Tax=Candidatus Kentrum sp. SD TaxID=2126332 RepID=A0A451BRX6_9GAMM|nr:MAG: hypothetical protein BECKSD772D_GA0070982_11931 [Candidatus Kentron sp. SD]
MIPEKLIQEEEELEEDKKVYPPFLVRQFRKGRERRKKNLPQSFSKITDFTQVIRTIWVISNKPYQEQYWGKQGQWGDNYGETTLTFFEDGENVLDANKAGRVSMTTKQRDMLQKLYDMVFEYDTDQTNPESRYGENDKAIVNDPKWQEIGKYAKIVYEELSGDDLDAWEKSRALAKP